MKDNLAYLASSPVPLSVVTAYAPAKARHPKRRRSPPLRFGLPGSGYDMRWSRGFLAGEMGLF